MVVKCVSYPLTIVTRFPGASLYANYVTDILSKYIFVCKTIIDAISQWSYSSMVLETGIMI